MVIVFMQVAAACTGELQSCYPAQQAPDRLRRPSAQVSRHCPSCSTTTHRASVPGRQHEACVSLFSLGAVALACLHWPQARSAVYDIDLV